MHIWKNGIISFVKWDVLIMYTLLLFLLPMTTTTGPKLNEAKEIYCSDYCKAQG